MPQHPPELQNEIKAEPSANFYRPAPKKSSGRRSTITKNAKQYSASSARRSLGEGRGRPALARHSRKCQICRHPDRELIEDLYIHWHSANSILDFINSASDDDADPDQNENNITWIAIYRHAYALGLDDIRRRNLRFAFELLIEQAGDIIPTSASILAAARAYSCISDDGRWSDPPKHVIVTNITRRESDASGSTPPVEAPVGVPLATPVSRTIRHSSSAVELSGAPPSPRVAEGGSANESADIVAAGLPRQPSPSAATSDVTLSAAKDLAVASTLPGDFQSASASVADDGPAVAFASSPLRDHGTRITGHESVPASDFRAAIRIPANPLTKKEKTFSNR